MKNKIKEVLEKYLEGVVDWDSQYIKAIPKRQLDSLTNELHQIILQH